MYRVTEAERGKQLATFTVGKGSQLWALDMVSNWPSVKTDDDGSGTYDSDEEDQRDHADPSDANELDQRSLIQQGSEGADLDLDMTYDKAGNLYTEDRQSGTSSVAYTYTHDAWNRLVKVVVGSDTRAQYQYNGLDWCIIKQADTDFDGTLDQQRMRYYSAGWQLCEERIDDDWPFTDDPTHADIDRHVQYVWGQRYIDDLLLHREDNDTNGTYDDTWYHLTDVQYSTVAILDDAAALVERVSYDAYGKARHHYMADWDGSGGVTQAEIDQINTVAGGANHAIGEANYNPDMDIDRNGDVAEADFWIADNESTHAALAKGLISQSSVDNQIGWDGYVFNAETRQYCVRHRTYDPIQGRWIERDPLGELAGPNLYEYVVANPLRWSDPLGLVYSDPDHDGKDDLAKFKKWYCSKHLPKGKKLGPHEDKEIDRQLRKGCLGITCVYTGSIGDFPDTKNCFGSHDKAKEQLDQWKDEGKCKGKDFCGNPAKPVMFAIQLPPYPADPFLGKVDPVTGRVKVIWLPARPEKAPFNYVCYDEKAKRWIWADHAEPGGTYYWIDEADGEAYKRIPGLYGNLTTTIWCVACSKSKIPPGGL